MKLRRQRLMLRKEEMNATPIISNPLRYISFYTPFAMFLLVGCVLSFSLYCARSRRRTEQSICNVSSCPIVSDENIQSAEELRENSGMIPRNEISLRPHPVEDVEASWRIRRGIFIGKLSPDRDVA